MKFLTPVIVSAAGTEGSAHNRLVLRLDSSAGRHILNYMVKFNAAPLDRTFAALADPTRRALLTRLAEQPGLSVSALALPFSVS